jgi:exonuclease III
MQDEDVNIIAIQETRISSNVNGVKCLVTRLIAAIHSSIHGISTYVKIPLADCHVTYQDHINHVHILAVEANGIMIVNVYKHLSENWSSALYKIFPNPMICAEDFKSHNQIWGYKHNNIDGNHRLSE